MPSYSGVWTLPAQYQAAGLYNWPGAFPPVTSTAGFISGGNLVDSSKTALIQYFDISTLGSSYDFGNLLAAGSSGTSCGSSTRGIIAANVETGDVQTNVIQYITYATRSNATDFGDMQQQSNGISSCASSTRGVMCGSNDTPTNTIQYITIASTGNAATFGQMNVEARLQGNGSCASTTRGIFAGGVRNGSLAYATNISYITIASTGNATVFGNLTTPSRYNSMASNSTRGIHCVGDTGGSITSAMYYITIATTGNGTLFGNLSTDSWGSASVASSTRNVIAVGASSYSAPVALNTLVYVTIATTGNPTSFGSLSTASWFTAGASNSHGGL